MFELFFRTTKLVTLAAGLVAGLCSQHAAADEPERTDADNTVASTNADRTVFERTVQPILAERCLECHRDAERNGNLRLDDASAITPLGTKAETDSGQSAIVPGHPDQSELLKRVTSTSEDKRMPPEGPRLSEEQVAAIRSWIKEGAKWSDVSISNANPTRPQASARMSSNQADERSSHWAFQPLTSSEQLNKSLQSQSSSWVWNEVDSFIQIERERQGLQVAPDANPHALARRVAYSLTGLPPSSKQLADFAQTTTSTGNTRAAQAQLVDELLSSPTYGERWGRHWMDWVRYADTAGDNSDYPIPQAYLYRNYVIDAFNKDLPYDRFLTEQLAGDLLPANSLDERNRQRIATGYLAMARRFGSLVERYPWHLTIEDTIDNVGRTMLGLTLSCARCHDHKFDPISTRDYYGVYGIFASTRYPMPGLELFQAQQHFVPLVPDEEAATTLADHQSKIDELSTELQRRLAECEQRALENAKRQGECTLDEERQMNDELDKLLLKARKAGENLAAKLRDAPSIPNAYAVQDDQPIDARIQIKGEPTRPGAQVPRKFPDILGGQQLDASLASQSSGRLQLAQWITHRDNPLTARVIVNRIWQRHFGTGLVASTSDFGLRGDHPTHPLLLDWLASELIRSHWSLKHIHRLILNSHTYQLSTRDTEANLAIDPANRWYWKANRQRLDAESLRDTLLFIAGALDLTPQTQPHPFPKMKDWKFTQHHPFKDDYPSDKRSVYLMTKRLTAKPYFQTFDGADPNVCTSDRDQSVTALQALYFVNDQFVHQQAERLADVLVQTVQSDTERIELAVEKILCRPTTREDMELIEDHVNQLKQQLKSRPERELWASVSRSLMRLNEFMYID